MLGAEGAAAPEARADQPSVEAKDEGVGVDALLLPSELLQNGASGHQDGGVLTGPSPRFKRGAEGLILPSGQEIGAREVRVPDSAAGL